MLSTDHGFSTSVKRSGHAACWCAALGGIVQFGGWPPSEQLSDVVRHEGSNCPLFYMPVTTVARHLHRADQRRRVDSLEAALAHHRQYRLRELLNLASDSTPGTPQTISVEDGLPVVGEGVAATAPLSPPPSALSMTTEEASERGFVYDEGYVSDVAESEGDASESVSSAFSSTDSAPHRMRDAAHDAAPAQPTQSPHLSALEAPAPPPNVTTPTITVELLRQVTEETEDRRTDRAAAASTITASHGGTTLSRGTQTGPAISSTLHSLVKSGLPAVNREAPPRQRDTQEVLGKYTVRPLRWHQICPPVAPRTRHGHHLVSCGDRLYVIGGSYWAHGNALASTDMVYDTRKKTWQQVPSLFSPRFCAALARSNAVPTAKGALASTAPTDASGEPPVCEEQVLYYFGGLNYSRELTNTLYRLWLPQGALEELPQYGAAPREQFKGILVCDIQRECSPAERKRGERAVGHLFYMDGMQNGRPMAPYLRVYNVATGIWVRVCPSPDLVRSQVSLLQYEAVADGNTYAVETAAVRPTRLKRFEVVGGMPSRRGKQRRSGMCYSFDAAQQRFDYSHALPVPGLTAHCTIPLPALSEEDVHTNSGNATAAAEVHLHLLADGVTSVAAYRAALALLREKYGVWSVCCGGNEDGSDAEQNSLGVPVGWLYLFAPRTIPLSEVARVQIDGLRIPMTALSAQKDELLDELF
ncbi:hypothetical protein ABB37_01304 [Leptomonas pyrrhocoris]|uniref:Uncharacterized protein n=1 Tax=Leptomonas pyrrhocoris TaxID=157538 RepID=A0A0N0DZ35_LEPPY|nr:hypothetical protein ABB37_01304 [Leptomonas pyrrhocoris]XP_015663271.1 hypothetical protein ABB37_01304 [Leptomonas pyrrhocoris]KPA84831.1 hypothetical protein ABB37_01304 [Leptomonas pyrrhocoris]KPA84832.1 hypothetical protein ABB37_01304 [Leptomonas pyrrhocoris]|eukprot:XP_015663270.1 hypothetical protein ABB37_01304 [Leptomonas pyrrhocoris]